MLYEASLKPACAIAALFWLIGWATVVIDLLMPQDDLGHLGLAFVATGAMLHLRGYYVDVCHRLDDHQAAFDIGKEIGQQSRPHSIR